MTMLLKNEFDINVWNRGAYLTEGMEEEDQYDEWVLCPYSVEEDGIYLNRVTELSDLNLVLTKEEAEALTLGWEPELGGDYDGGDDFWLYMSTFKETYKNIPQSVLTWIDFVTALL